MRINMMEKDHPVNAERNRKGGMETARRVPHEHGWAEESAARGIRDSFG